MSLREKGLFVSLESYEDNDGISLEEIALEAEEAVKETDEEVEEIVSDTNDVEEAAKDSETLERIKDTMEESVEEGEGLSEDAAEIAEVAIEAIYDRLGLEKSPMPAMESFGSSNSRVTATRIAIESIAVTIKKVWTAIKDFFAKIFMKIKSFFVNFEKSLEKLEDYVETLTKEASDVKAGAKPKEKDIKNPSLGKKFNIKGKANLQTLTEITDNSTAPYQIIDALSKKCEQLFKVIGSSINKNSDGSPDINSDKIIKEIEETVKAFEEVGNIVEVRLDKKDPNTKHYVFGPVLGGKKIIYTVKIKDKGIKISLSTKEDKKDPPKTIKALTLNEIETVLSALGTLLSVIKTNKKFVKDAESVNKAAITIVNSVIDVVENVGDDLSVENKVSLSGIKETVTSFNTTISRSLTVIPSTALDSVKAAADYAKVSLKNLEVKK